jgi:chromate reductase
LNDKLSALAGKSIGTRAEFIRIDYTSVPFFNQDIEFPAPEPISQIREQVIAADGIWFFSPEYNHYFPGVLKNLIDWLSRPISKDAPQVLSQKPATVSGITPGMSGTLVAQDHLVTLLSFLNMRVMNLPRLTIPSALSKLKNGELDLAESSVFLQKQADSFLEFIEKLNV